MPEPHSPAEGGNRERILKERACGREAREGRTGVVGALTFVYVPPLKTPEEEDVVGVGVRRIGVEDGDEGRVDLRKRVVLAAIYDARHARGTAPPPPPPTNLAT